MGSGIGTGAQRKGPRGFSLIELMIALALSGVVLVTAGTMLLQSYANEAAYREQNEAQRNARAALDMVVDDLREASLNGVRVVTFPTRTNYTFVLVYSSDLSRRQIRYWIEGTDLIRQVRSTAGQVIPGYSPVVVARNLRRSDGISSPFTIKPVIPEDPALPVTVMTVTVTTIVGHDPNDKDDVYSTVTLQSNVTMRNSLF